MARLISKNDFDSGLLANHVGQVHVDHHDWNSIFEKQVIEEACERNFDLVMFKSSQKIETCPQIYHVGTLEQWSGNLLTVKKNLKVFSKRFKSTALTKDDLSELKPLLSFSSPTRFSSDFKISSENVTQHKLKLIETYLSKPLSQGRLAFNSNGQMIGFHVAYSHEDDWVLYELLVSPLYRNGFVSGQLVSELLDHSLAQNTERVMTSIYEENMDSKKFFSRIGLQPTSIKHHHYHFWPQN